MAAAEKKEQEIWETDAWKALTAHAQDIKKLHLRDLLNAKTNGKLKEREASLKTTFENIHLDSTRQVCDDTTLSKLVALAKAANVCSKIEAMYSGAPINKTENRSVLHVALRAPPTQKIVTPNDNEDQVPKVHKVLNQIKDFSTKVRNGGFKGYSGKELTNVISIGIGGSYLGAEFVFEALRTNTEAKLAAKGRSLRFHANIDPIGWARAVEGLDPERTIAIVVSKTFTTRETMMNATLIREWFLEHYKGSHPNAKVDAILARHFVAVSANPQGPRERFNVSPANIFEFWDWVGGRYSVTSAVGMLPLSLHYGFDVMAAFLKGCHSVDQHFFDKRNDLAANVPALLGLLGVWNASFLGHGTRALIPYCDALSRLPAHIQQLDMESNGKRVSVAGGGKVLPFPAGEVNFGEPGTNAQHSFFQLIHQGRPVPVDFVGFCRSQLGSDQALSKGVRALVASNHDELMSNFFAQADALAIGKTTEQVRAELEEKKVDAKRVEYLLNHKEFPGNRPSSLLLFDGSLDAYATGQLLALFEHRTVVQGFVWGIGSFDQWGVELGKMLGKKVRGTIDAFRKDKAKVTDYNQNTINVLSRYLEKSSL